MIRFFLFKCLQITSRIECKFQQAKPVARYNWFRVTKPKKAIGKLEQTGLPPSLDLPPHESPNPRCSSQLSPIPPPRPRKPNQPTSPQCEPKFPIPSNPTLLHRPSHLSSRVGRELQQDHRPTRVHRVPQEAPKAQRRRESARLATHGSHGARNPRG